MNKSHFSFPFTFALPLLCLFTLASTYFVVRSARFYLDVPIQTATPGNLKLWVDEGAGFPSRATAEVKLPAGESRIAHLRLPTGKLRRLRFELPAGETTVFLLDDAVVRSRAGKASNGDRILKRIRSTDFEPAQEIRRVIDIGSQRHLYTTWPGANPICVVRNLEPIALDRDYVYLVPRLLALLGGCVLLGLAAARIEYRVARLSTIVAKALGTFVVSRPIVAIFCAAAAGVVASCYPVVFCGKSFVSPNMTTVLLYDRFPTVPIADQAGATDFEDPLGADLGAMIWQNYSMGVAQADSILNHKDLPLWDRYNWSGVPLLGQGQSMFGDPLHFIAIFGRGSSVAWDVKFLLAKLLFAFVIGLIIYCATGSPYVSVIMAGTVSFIGFFTFRFNHPAFFSFCYSPLILLMWLRIAQARSLRDAMVWLLGLFAANWMQINSGTVKEAYMLCVGMNLTGVLLLIAFDGSWYSRGVKLLHGGLIGLAFVISSTPIWLTFVNTLDDSFTSSDVPVAYQTIGRYVLGLFDDIFYRQLHASEGFLLPSANFIVLLGCLLSLFYLASRKRSRVTVLLIIAMIGPLAMIFSIVPGSLIVDIPFIGRIGNIHLVFSTVVIVQLVILAGIGLKQFEETLRERGGLAESFFVALCLGALLAVYFGSDAGGPIVLRSKLADDYMVVITIATALLLLFAVLQSRAGRGSVICSQTMIICVGLLLWRHGLHMKTEVEHVDKLVLNPQIRANLLPVSPALDSIRPIRGEAHRIIGFHNNLFPGYNRAQRIEGISGADALQNRYYRELTIAAGLDYSWSWFIKVTEQNIQQAKAMCDLLNVRYYLALPGTLPAEVGGMRRIRTLDFDVYESDTVWPRAFFTDEVSPYESVNDFVDLLRAGDGRPFAAVRAGDEPPDLRPVKHSSGQLAGRSIVAGENYILAGNQTTFEISAPGPGLVVLGESYWPNDIEVTVNGVRQPCFQVNGAFRGVAISKAGRYYITFTYWPQNFSLSLILFAVAICGLVLWWIATRHATRPAGSSAACT